MEQSYPANCSHRTSRGRRADRGGRMAEIFQAGEFIGPGEKAAAAYLEEFLPDGWLVVCNKEIVRRTGTVREADFIIVGTTTVFVVEEKSWTGRIVGND